MTALERARRFISRGASTTALVIVPLAAAAPASASTITFETSTATAVASATGATPTGGAGVFSALPNGGIEFTSSADYSFAVAVPASGSSPGTLTLALSGDGDGGALTMANIAASYDYLFGLGSGSFPLFTSSISFYINGVFAGSGAGGASASGSVPLTGWTPGDPLAFWEVVIGATFETPTGGTISLSVPSVRITPPGQVTPPDPPPTAVPEPASLLLVGSGVVASLVGRRRRS